MLTFKEIRQAAKILNGVVMRTQLMESELLNQQLGFRLILKPECLQRTGSFKIRGAYAKIASILPKARQSGVVAFSSGNHAQGVAAAATALGVKSTIVMPDDAPEVKLKRAAEYGAEVITYDRVTGDRAQIAKDLANRTGAQLIPPYDDFVVMSGQGTVGLEIAEQLAERDITADTVLCPVGGGGLIAGTATALSGCSVAASVHPVEPEGFDDTARSLKLGQRVKNPAGSVSICDSIVTERPGALTFPINHSLLSNGLVVSDKQVIAAIGTIAEHFRILAEPGGAVGIAAALKDAEVFAGKTVVAIVSGGNVDKHNVARWMI